MADLKATSPGKHLTGVKIVLTGDFTAHSRDEATRLLEACGADVTGSVSGKTNVVIAGVNAGASKLGQAKTRNLPVLGEPQLLALLAGKTVAEVLAEQAPTAAGNATPAPGEAAPAPSDSPSSARAKSTSPAAAEAQAKTAPAAAAPAPAAAKTPTVPFPKTPVRPRDGVFTESLEGTTKVLVQGAFAGGLKQGSWKRFDESGQLREDYSFDRGVPHGPELDWHANGAKSCEGENRRGKRSGEWRWFHENGARSYSYTYDDAGRKQGEHQWDLEDGSKRARGQYVDDQMHGHWTWWHEGNLERIERDLWQGVNHGTDEAWFRGGALAYRRHFQYGTKHSLEEVYKESGDAAHPASTLTFRGEWKGGFAVGEHLSVDDAGVETRTLYTDGLSAKDLDPEARAVVLKKLAKAKDKYAKADAITDHAGHGGRGPYLLYLFREGHLDVAADPEIWDLWAYTGILFRGEDILKLLGAIRGTNVGHGSFLPYWPDDLDRLVMSVYAREAETIDAGAAALPEAMRKGLAFVQGRFGRAMTVSLHSEMAELASKHVKQYGLGKKVLWPDAENRIVEQAIFSDFDGTTTPLFARFIALFGTEAEWRTAVQQQAEEQMADGRLRFGEIRPAIEVATPEQMVRYLSAIALDSNTQDLIFQALTEWRKDDPQTLTRIALGVNDDGLRKWPTVSVALLALAAAGQSAPPELIAALPLAVESPTYSLAWCSDPLRALTEAQKRDPAVIAATIPIGPGCAVPRTRRLREALATLPQKALASIIDRQLAQPYGKTYGNQYLYLADDPDLWARAIKATEADPHGSSDASTYGLGDLAEPGIPLLLALQKRVKGKDWKEGVARALLVALARTIVAKGTFAPQLDTHVSFSAVAKDYDYRFYEPFLRRIIHLLPSSRAEPLLLAGLASKHFSRAFRMIGSHPTEPVLHAAFNELLARETTLKSEDQEAVAEGIGSLPNAVDWVKWILQSGAGGGMERALAGAVGHKVLEALSRLPVHRPSSNARNPRPSSPIRSNRPSR